MLPCTYFTTEPFENWTRSATEIMGTVEFDVDFSVPFDEMRAELDRLLAESDLWDGRRGVLQVTDAVGGSFGCGRGQRPERRRAVRPSLCGARRHGQLGAAPGRAADAADRGRRNDHRGRAAPHRRGGETKRVSSGMFSGSPEADARARAFDDTDDREDDFISPNGRG